MSGFYRYYDTPDGQDFFKKEYYLARKVFPYSYYLACGDILAWSSPSGVVPVTVRFFQVFSRPLIMVTLWTSTTYMATRLRGKDDPVNHALGVIPLAFYAKNFLPALSAYLFAVPCMMVAYGCKRYKMWYPDMVFIPENTVARDNVENSVFADYFSYLLLKIKEKNWVSIEDAIKKGIVANKEEAKEKKLTNFKDGQARGLVRIADGSENMDFHFSG